MLKPLIRDKDDKSQLQRVVEYVDQLRQIRFISGNLVTATIDPLQAEHVIRHNLGYAYVGAVITAHGVPSDPRLLTVPAQNSIAAARELVVLDSASTVTRGYPSSEYVVIRQVGTLPVSALSLQISMLVY